MPEKSSKEQEHSACSPFFLPMAEQAPLLQPAAKLPCRRAKQKWPYRAFLFALFVVLLPLLPSQAPPGLAAEQSFLTKAWELLHLLFVGVAVSYGLFSRKNDDRHAEKDVAAKPDSPQSYVSEVLHDSLGFDDDELLYSPRGGVEDSKVQSWSSLHRPAEPVVMVASNGGRNHGADKPPLSLPVRSLKSHPPDTNGERPRSFSTAPDSGADTVLPSPIPWRSRSGRFDTAGAASPAASPRRPSPASSSSKETFAKTGEDPVKRRSPHMSSPPPAPPPPPPPPFLGHSHSDRKTAAKSFKEELKDHSMRDREDHLRTSYSFNSTHTRSVVKPRSSFDGSSSSFGKSVRTIRPREADAAVHGTEEPYGYREYQSIPKFQYEKVSDQILDKVTVSSDDSESSGDDGDGDGDVGEYSSSERASHEVDENEVDRKADEFIAKFREQIRLQRIESIKRSTGPRGLKHAK